MGFGEYHMNSVDLKNYENLCKDERQKCEHRTNNKNSNSVRHYKVDGSIFINCKKCDKKKHTLL